MSHEEVAERIGKDRSTVANSIRLLKLPLPVRQLVEAEQRATEELVKKQRSPAKAKPRKAAVQKTASVRDLEERLTRTLGGPVAITEDEPGKAGRIEIRYLSLDHLERLLDRLL